MATTALNSSPPPNSQVTAQLVTATLGWHILTALGSIAGLIYIWALSDLAIWLQISFSASALYS